MLYMIWHHTGRLDRQGRPIVLVAPKLFAALLNAGRPYAQAWDN